MVIEDHSFSSKQQLDQNGERADAGVEQNIWPLASPVDRFAACLVDFVILVPLLSLAFAFFKREIFLIELSGTQPALDVMVWVYFGLSVSVVIFYQTIFAAWLGATPGKYFFGLRIVDVWHHGSPHWQRCFLRSVLWWVDVFFVLPFIALFSDIKRRPIHDRLSDTIVLATPARSVAPPKGYETQLARSFFAALFVFVGGYLMIQSPGFYLAAAKSGLDVSAWAGGKHLCKEVDRSLDAWSPKNLNKNNTQWPAGHRLKVAMSLYGAQQIDSDCLNQEADYFIWIEKGEANESSLGYLAKAFSKIDDPELSDRYLDKVCEIDEGTEACRLSQVIGLWSEEKWHEIDQIFDKSDLQESVYYKIWEIRHHFRVGRFEKVREIIESVSPNFALADFLGEYRIKVHWRQRHESQAQSGFKMYWENQAGGEKRLPIASWLCYEEMAKDCGGWKSASCSVIKKTIGAYPTILENSKVALAKLRSLQCQGKGVDHVGVIFSEEVLTYGEATDVTSYPRQQVFENLVMFAGDQGRSPIIQFDAMARAIETASSDDEYQKLISAWDNGSEKQSWGWKFMGQKLFSRLAEGGHGGMAFIVAEKLHQQGDRSPQAFENLARARLLMGDRHSAFQWLSKVNRKTSGRQPASVHDWQVEKDRLIEEFSE